MLLDITVGPVQVREEPEARELVALDVRLELPDDALEAVLADSFLIIFV